MLKNRTRNPPFVEHIEAILRVPFTSFIEFNNSQDLDTITAPWLALEWYNLDSEGTEPDDDMNYPQAAIFASLHHSEAVNAFYVQVITEDSQYLFALESSSKSIDLIRSLRTRYQAALKEAMPVNKSPH